MPRILDAERSEMRGQPNEQPMMLAWIDVEARVPRDHPLRTIKKLADTALRNLSDTFDRMYAASGRRSIPPERLLKASLLIPLFSIRSERQFCEQLEYNFLYRWFLDMDPWEPVFDATTFTKNRQRLLTHNVGRDLFDEIVADAHERGLLSDEHFTVDGTLIQAAASFKSFKRKDGTPPTTTDDDPGNPSVDFHGERRSNATHQSTTDPEALLFKKSSGSPAHLAFLGHALMENRHGMLVDFLVSQATGTAERDAVPKLLHGANERHFRPTTLGGDKNYDTAGCVAAIRHEKVTPHVAQNTARKGGSAIDGRTTRHDGYRVSQRIRKRVEEIFGWMKTVGGLRTTRYRGVDRTGLCGYFVGAAYNLVRMSRLLVKAEVLPAAA
jgi:transposase